MAQTPPTEQTAPQRLAIDDAVVVDAPIREVYQQWSDLTRFPEFMSNIIGVTPMEGDRYHWVASFFGQRQEWDAEVTGRADVSHIAWRSVTGPESNGELTFTPQGEDATQVRLRMEITPPTELAPQRFDKLAQNARKNARKDMRRYGQQIGPAQQRTRVDEAAASPVSVASQLGVALVAAGAGAYLAYLANQRLTRSRAPHLAPRPVALSADIASWVFAGASAASMLGAVTYRQLGQMDRALFVGQWAPTLLATGGLVRMLGRTDIQTDDAAAIVSWSFVGGSVGSMLASATLYGMGRRKQGLVVGQWASALMSAAAFTRLVNPS